jgi:hypothetical protein
VRWAWFSGITGSAALISDIIALLHSLIIRCSKPANRFVLASSAGIALGNCSAFPIAS